MLTHDKRTRLMDTNTNQVLGAKANPRRENEVYLRYGGFRSRDHHELEG